jgi:hypothetical protein
MDTWSAFAMGNASRDKELKVFDWNKAAAIIKKRGAQEASAGLEADLEWTAGTIIEDGKPVTDGYAYLSSTWATPLLIIDEEEIDCFSMQSEVPDWGSGTWWPKSALEILHGTVHGG